MNPVVQAHFSEFKKTFSIDTLKDSDLFEIFSIHCVENGLNGENIDAYSAHLHGSEFGLDGIAVLVNGQLIANKTECEAALDATNRIDIEFHMYQTKRSEGLDYGDVSKFFDGVLNFFKDSFPEPTEQIEDLYEVKSVVYAKALRKNPRLKLYYITSGVAELTPHLKMLIGDKTKLLEAMSIFSNVNFHPIAALELQNGYRAATVASTETIEMLKSITLPDHTSVTESLLGIISGSELIKLITTDDDDVKAIRKPVFFDNIRDYDPDSEINKSIIADLKSNNPASFVFKNNGITIVAKNITRTGDKFTLEDYQIVNGCQTSNIIFQCQEFAEKIFVPVRMIASSDFSFVSSVIIGTNKQNQVSEDQFWSLSPFMKNLETYSRGFEDTERLYLERRENQYRGEAIERTRIVKVSELVKAVLSTLLHQPHKAARDYRSVRKDNQQGIFLESHSVQIYHAVMWANYRIDYMIRNGNIDRKHNIFRYFILYMVFLTSKTSERPFNMSAKEVDAASKDIVRISNDEILLNKIAAIVYDEISLLTDVSAGNSREKMRDYIRSDTNFKNIDLKLRGHAGSLKAAM